MEQEIYQLIICKLLKKGKKTKAEKIFLNCLKELKEKGEKNPMKTFLIGLENITPLVEIKTKKVGGTVYRIPVEIKQKRARSLGVSWLLESVKKIKKGRLSTKLCNEILLAKEKQGRTIERVKELHSFAEKNRGLVKFL